MYALVTGAGSGIGAAIAKRLSQDGYGIIAVGRRREPLEILQRELATPVRVITADLSTQEDCFRLYQSVKDEPIQIVVNNAGFGVFGPFTETDLGGELQMIGVNIQALHILIKLFLKDFTARNDGYILNVASAAAFLPGPLFSSYYASKAYVLRLTEAIREELRRARKNVYIGALCPGPVDTQFNNVAGVAFSLPGLRADDVADYAVRRMYARKAVIVPGITMKLVRFFSKLVPDSIAARLAWYSQRRKLG
ncbi:MAG: SDR family oxidoreductase [Clostridia bacterium]|nr:SDR family oxidoreductase [Clostridia bacterium]